MTICRWFTVSMLAALILCVPVGNRAGVWGQSTSGTAEDMVVIEKRAGMDSVLIDDVEFNLAPRAKILDEDGRPTRLSRIIFPVEARVRFSAARQGEREIQELQLMRLPQ